MVYTSKDCLYKTHAHAVVTEEWQDMSVTSLLNQVGILEKRLNIIKELKNNKLMEQQLMSGIEKINTLINNKIRKKHKRRYED